MGKFIRVLAALAGLMIIVAVGLRGMSWANKLSPAERPATAGAFAQGLPAASRPQGTVITTNPVVKITAGQVAAIGSCATVLIQSVPAGFSYTASVVPATDLAQTFPGNLLSCGIKLEAKPPSVLGAETEVCFPIPPTRTGFTYYWDGTQWVQTTLGVTGFQSCVVVPPTAPNPTFTALFGK